MSNTAEELSDSLPAVTDTNYADRVQSYTTEELTLVTDRVVRGPRADVLHALLNHVGGGDGITLQSLAIATWGDASGAWPNIVKMYVLRSRATLRHLGIELVIQEVAELDSGPSQTTYYLVPRVGADSATRQDRTGTVQIPHAEQRDESGYRELVAGAIGAALQRLQQDTDSTQPELTSMGAACIKVLAALSVEAFTAEDLSKYSSPWLDEPALRKALRWLVGHDLIVNEAGKWHANRQGRLPFGLVSDDDTLAPDGSIQRLRNRLYPVLPPPEVEPANPHL